MPEMKKAKARIDAGIPNVFMNVLPVMPQTQAQANDPEFRKQNPGLAFDPAVAKKVWRIEGNEINISICKGELYWIPKDADLNMKFPQDWPDPVVRGKPRGYGEIFEEIGEQRTEPKKKKEEN
jgi:hypothetical protein